MSNASAPQNLHQLRDWIGKTETHTDTITAWPAAALAATLDRAEPQPAVGDALPPGWHRLYFLETTLTSELSADGHPKRGDFLPPAPLPRRMWAGGRLEFRHPLRVGDFATRTSEIISVDPKQGKSGALVFVTVRHTITVAGEIATIEEHDIVYREAMTPGAPPPQGRPAASSAPWQRSVTADAILLFRFSALTFNGHRIHYDADYARNEERYPALIVHGPLQMLLLLDLCRRHDERGVKKLDYRALHPIFNDERFTMRGQPSADNHSAELWTANAAGICAMTGTAVFE